MLEQLRRTPIIEAACARAGVSRAQFYRMSKEDGEFDAAAKEAMAEGVAFINDLSESQLIQMIKDRNFAAIRLWLQVHSPAYSRKLEISGKIGVEESMTDEDQKLLASLKEALSETHSHDSENE